MYHPDVIARNQAEWEARTGVKLRRYPVDEVRHYVNHFEDLTIRDPKTKRPVDFSRTLYPDEQAFIVNERALCKLDLNYEIERYEFVEDVITAKLHLMRLNKAQQVAMKLVADLELQRRPIMLLFLKARQLGVSTLFGMIIKHRMNFVEYTKGVVASGKEDKTRAMVEKMIEKPHKMLPWWLVRHDVKFQHSGDEFMRVDSADSLLYVQHGQQELGISRGSTTNTWHFSELMEWADPKSHIEAGFNRAVHESEATFGVEETTASSRGSWLHRYWETVNADYLIGTNSRYPVFLPYFIGDDIYPPPGFVVRPDGWEPTPLVKAHVDSCERYVKASPLLREVLGPNWKMPIEQQWWYHIEYTKAVKDPESFANFLAECPANPYEAFQSRSRSVVEATKLQELQRGLRPLWCGPLLVTGPEVPLVSQPSLEPVVQEVEYQNGQFARRWTLHEESQDAIEDYKQPQHRIWVWELPRRDAKYAIGVDCGLGLGKDRTAIQVVKLGNAQEQAVQVAEYASDSASAFDVVGLYLMLLTWYSPPNFKGERNWALAAPEDAADGKSIINELRKWNWPEIYIRQKPEDRRGGVADGSLYGWHTDQSNRTTLINWFLKFIKERRIQINSPWLLDEIRDFVMIAKKSSTSAGETYKIQHDRDAHDDRIFALAIAIVCGHGIDLAEDVTRGHWAGVAQANEVRLPEHTKGWGFRVKEDKPSEEVEMVQQWTGTREVFY